MLTTASTRGVDWKCLREEQSTHSRMHFEFFLTSHHDWRTLVNRISLFRNDALGFKEF